MSFTLPIFPEGSLAESVVTTVWVGVFVLCLLNLRFGWTLSGLVVPGYIVPLILVKPLAALVVFGEGVLTYLIVYSLTKIAIRSGRGANLFGRDRFYALVLTSIGVRVAFDGYLFPYLSRLAAPGWLLELDLVNNLHSFGLIIVSLIANQFWKPGLVRGLTPFLTTVGITYLIVRYPLMHWTNFSVGSFQYMYEDIAASVLASPKAYILLVTTAFIASRLNLYYSWDFNGILIPSLIAIQWYEPLKVLTSFAEAWIIFLAGSNLLKLKWFKETTIEGARKILLFFNISFAYKMLLGHILIRLFPGLQVSDCFGFGYLLTSLLAMKMHDKGIPIRITRTTLQASIVGAAVASAVGFLLTLLPQEWSAPASAEAVAKGPESVESSQTLIDRLRADKVLLYQWRRPGRVLAPMPSELDAFTAGLRSLRGYLGDRDPERLERARLRLSAARYDVSRHEGRYLYLSENAPRNGWGTYVLDEETPRGLLVEVPAPLDEWATMESGAFLFKVFNARAFSISSGGGRFEETEGPAALSTRRTFFDAFHRVFAAQDVLEVRGYSAGVVRSLYGRQPGRGSLESPDIPSSIWVKSQLPPGLSLSLLKELVNDIRVEWRSPSFKNLEREATASGFAELFLKRDDRKRLLARWAIGSWLPGQAAGREEPEELGTGLSLREWLLGLGVSIAQRGTNLYVPPSPESLLFLDEEVLKPAVKLMVQAGQGGISKADTAIDIEALRGPARALDYEVLLHEDPGSGKEYLILCEDRKAARPRRWGTWVVRLGPHRPFALEVPHPDYEENTLEYGVALFEKLNAACLLVAGSHPKCNTDGSADVVLFENRRSFFNLVNQVILRETGVDPFCVVQLRALGYRQGAGLPDADALLAFSDASCADDTLSPLAKELVGSLRRGGVSVRLVDGSRPTAGYEVYGSAQALYLSHTMNKECCGLWLSPFIRLGYRQYSERSLQEAQFVAVGVETSERDLAADLLEAASVAPETSIPDGLTGLLRHYRSTRDINSLHSITRLWPGLGLHRVIERSTQRAYLLARDGGALLPLVTNLSLPMAGRDEASDLRLASPPALEDIRRFVESGACFLFWRPGS